MRALLQERQYLANQRNISFEKIVNILYFGCKSRKLDFLYEDELTTALDRHILTSLKVAFSRETVEKVYVQDLMREPENAEELYRLFERGAHIFVCGATGMGSAVSEAFASILVTHKGRKHFYFMNLSLGITLEEARGIMKEAQRGKIYKQELWSS
jgi:sulfite reductase alpha subunit-like flavoprotein